MQRQKKKKKKKKKRNHYRKGSQKGDVNCSLNDKTAFYTRRSESSHFFRLPASYISHFVKRTSSNRTENWKNAAGRDFERTLWSRSRPAPKKAYERRRDEGNAVEHLNMATGRREKRRSRWVSEWTIDRPTDGWCYVLNEWLTRRRWEDTKEHRRQERPLLDHPSNG